LAVAVSGCCACALICCVAALTRSEIPIVPPYYG